MNVIKQGDPEKIKEYNHKHELKTFRCPICGCVWEASIKPGTTEARITLLQDQRDSYQAWVSDCPMAECKGVGREYDVERCPSSQSCKDCKYFNGWASPARCDLLKHNMYEWEYDACSNFEQKEVL